MTTYHFATITPTQALALQPDDIVAFDGGPARLATVAYNIPFAGPATITVTYGGHSVEFAMSLVDVSERGGLTFGDGSHLLVGGPGPDPLLGFAYDDALFGGQDDDTLVGQGGDDVIQGNSGNDRILTEHGADTIYGGQGDDVIRTGLNVGGEKGDFAQGNLGADTIQGGGGADTLLGGRDDDQVNGGEGNDLLRGDLGHDQLRGGGGDDTLSGGDGNDTLYAGGGRDLLDGGSGDDFIAISGAGAGTVDGGDGADTILAYGVGRDLLQGGAGVDRFEFITTRPPTEGQDDTILDWNRSEVMAFDRATIYAATTETYAEITAADYAGALAQANGLISGGKAIYVAARVGGDVVVFADTDGLSANGADAAVVLAGRSLADIDASNFV